LIAHHENHLALGDDEPPSKVNDAGRSFAVTAGHCAGSVIPASDRAKWLKD
jgi:hypothetical protein